ncbi:unnamed protein product [Caenorhabditis auriculariae]|uniref:Uncharacterized protein n=1 Tax=Caenorhabditis auriculariae TaxID=2777116 RepID=A0A8S1GSG6_9PELO|nr:unnamed protein product [Caenorhabditis auriculariae]
MRPELFLALLAFLCASFSTGETRYERVGFVSDPIKLLLQDSYSSLKNRMYSGYQKISPYRQVRKRKYTAFPPTFYSSFGFGALPFASRRHISLPYNDLFFSG